MTIKLTVYVVVTRWATADEATNKAETRDKPKVFIFVICKWARA